MTEPSKISAFITSIGLPIPNVVRNHYAGNVLCERGHGKYMLYYVWGKIKHDCSARQLSEDSRLIHLAQIVDIQVFSDLYNKIKCTIERDIN